MAKKHEAPKTRAGGRWTQARYDSFIRSALRRAFIKWPVQYDVRREARRDYQGDNPRQKHEYQCALCEGWFAAKETQVDHFPPCGSLRPLDTFVERLFCERKGLRLLCKPCHKQVTKEQRTKK